MASSPTPADVLARLKPVAAAVKNATQQATQAHYQQAPAVPAPPTPQA